VSHALLFLVPAIAVALPLLVRRYPGEEVLIALRTSRPALPRAARTVRGHGRSNAWAPRGGLLMGRSLAVRPPPLATPAS